MAVGLVLAIIAFVLSLQYVRWSVALIMAWDAFAISSLVLAWLGMFFTDAKTRVREAHLQDSSRAAICGCVVAAAMAGLLGVWALLGSADMAGIGATRSLILAALTVLLSWFLVHTMLALHYTHVFYCSCESAGSEARGVGLLFPEEPDPDFLDFAYFSFVVGMTFQVADVKVTSRRMRRMVLLHALLSFVFNTVILAFSVNLALTFFSGAGTHQ